jgi:hypothetical protein
LPFTGPGDLFLGLVLALLAMMGGAMLYLKATSSELSTGLRANAIRISGWRAVRDRIERERDTRGA